MKVPPLLPRFVVMPDGERFVPLEQVIAAHLDQLFPGHGASRTTYAFRVTRNADLTLEEEEADDLLAAVEIELRRRRFGRAVRLEIDADVTDEVRELLQRELDLDDDDVYAHAGPARPRRAVGGARPRPARPEGRPVCQPVTQPRLDGRRRRAARPLRRPRASGDVLVHHPYDSFTHLGRGVHPPGRRRPAVLAIKLTLYRTSGDSPIVQVAHPGRRAGQAGGGARRAQGPLRRGAPTSSGPSALEEAGVHVVYGLVGLKTHTKTALVVRDEPDGIRRYCHIGTGNYNSKTARIYEDLGLLTRDPDIGADLTQLFNFLTGYGRNVRYRKLLVAPAQPAAPASRSSSATRWRRRPGTGPHHHEDEQPGRPGR